MFHLGLGCNRHPMPGGHYPLQYILGDTPSLIYLDSSCYLLVPVVVASLSWPLAQVFCAAPEKVFAYGQCRNSDAENGSSSQL